MYTPPSIRINVKLYGDVKEPSLFDITVLSGSPSSPSYLAGQIFDGWCIDRSIDIFAPNDFVANVYSSYELDLLRARIPTLGVPNGFVDNLDSINWLLNFFSGVERFPTTNALFTRGEVQAAIWELLGEGWKADRRAALGNPNDAHVTWLVNQALANNGFVPGLNQKIGVVLDPFYVTSGAHAQPLIIETVAAALGDYVWEDTDFDGVQDMSEVGINGVTVNLGRDKNGDGDIADAGEIVATTFTRNDTTGNAGYYEFLGLTPGLPYVVEFIQPTNLGYNLASPALRGGDAAKDSNAVTANPAGTGFWSQPVTLNPGQFNRTIDAGFAKTAGLGDYVWADADLDGEQDDTEDGINGATVNLLRDLNGDGNFFEDDGFTYDAGELVATTTTATNTTTGKDGYYEFTGLTPGVEYVVEFARPVTGTVIYDIPSDPNVAGDTVDSDAVYDPLNTDPLASGFSAPVILASGEFNSTIDAGFFFAGGPGPDDPLNSLGTTVFLDANGNGIQDAGEPGVPEVVVELYDGNGQAVLDAFGQAVTTTTDQDGNYSFTGLPAGDYSVKFVLPDGYAFTQQATVAADAQDLDSDADRTSGFSGVVTLAPVSATEGENEIRVDAGLVQAASLGNFVFIDSNGNGVFDGGDVAKSGVTVKLQDASGNPVTDLSGNVVADQTTDANGGYLFTNLTPGDYRVQFVLPNGFAFTTASQAAADAVNNDSDADRSSGLTGTVTLSSGEEELDVDAGLVQAASIGDTVFIDSNANGVLDGGEEGKAGVTVRLRFCDSDAAVTDIDGNVVQPTTTDALGNYLFENLKPGEYKVEFVLPNGYVFTQQSAVAADATDNDSDANPATGLSGCIDLSSGEAERDVDAGLFSAAVDIEKYVSGRYTTGDGGGAEGLTPGFWKNWADPAHGNQTVYNAAWPATGYTPSQSYESIFGVDVPGAPSLLDALGANGGDVNALLRHSAAALLNAANPNVDYTYSVAQVIAMTQAALNGGNIASTKDLFATQNELGADLSTPASMGTTVNTPFVDADTAGTGPVIPVGGEALFRYEVKNTGDVELSNVQVTDDRIANLVFDANSDTDQDGKLDPGETWIYTAREAVSAGSNIVNIGTVTGKAGGITVTDSDAAHYSTTGLMQSLGDRVWLDANRNGVQDNGEAGVANVTVKLLNAAGVELDSTTTDGEGNYLFDDLAAGNYAIQVVAPTGYLFTGKDLGGNDDRDSDVDATTGKSVTTTLAAGEVDLSWDAGLVLAAPKIDIEKTTSGVNNANPTAADYDNEDTASGAGVPILTPGSAVTWTYKVTNTGNTTFARSALAIVDDNGTVSNTADDMTIANGRISLVSGQTAAADNLLQPGETWLYQATGTAQSLTTLGTASTFDFSSGGTSANGIRTFTLANGMSVRASAFSRTTSGTWASASLGQWSSGLGVTDGSEDGSAPGHTVDNVGRANYVLFEFDRSVVVDSTFLGYVNCDSDLTAWIGTANNPSSNRLTLSDSLLNGWAKEDNDTTSSSARWADLNASNRSGNVLVIAASTSDTTPDDYFKIDQVKVQEVLGGVYSNKATVTANTGTGSVTDFDLSHYKTAAAPPAPAATASIGNRVWCDTDGDGIQDSGEAGVANVDVKLLNAAGTVVRTTRTDTSGNYSFTGLAAGDYRIEVVKPTGYQSFTRANQGTDDTVDSDVDVATGRTALTTLVAGENDTSWDAGFAPNRSTVCFDFSGSTATDGTDGNTRTYTSGSLSVTAAAWSRDKSTGAFSKAWLGAYGSGLGVTDSSEGNGSSNSTHTVDNNGRDNYIVFQFSRKVVIDKAYLGYVIGDSDLTAWVGNSTTALTGLNQNILNGFAKEHNDTELTTARWANLNAGSLEGNVLVIAAREGHSVDYFKVDQVVVSAQDTLVTPLALDLDGNGIQTVALAEAGGSFDLFGNGQAVKSGWLSGGDGFLAIDANGNGSIDDIDELFGGFGQGDAFAKLAGFDSNSDGLVDAHDADFGSLKIWRDANGNHQTDAGELISLGDLGIQSLSTSYRTTPFMDESGNLHFEQGSATLVNGASVDLTDVYFSVSAADAAAAGVALPNLADLLAGGGAANAAAFSVEAEGVAVDLIGQSVQQEYAYA